MTQRKVAIVGAGMTGAYLHRLLRNAGIDAEIFDRPKSTACGLTPCAWGTSAEFAPLLAAAGLSADEYLLQRFDRLVIDGIALRAELMSFDKPRLVRDLLGGTSVSLLPPGAKEYDRIIDATGSSRAVLPPLPGDLVLRCQQSLVESEKALDTQVKLVGVGYAWRFPLGNGRYHVGCGSVVEEPAAVLHKLGWLESTGGSAISCGCTGKIRLSGPRHSLPMVHSGPPEIIGVGEAIGCVAPLVGDGVVPGMRSALLLREHWEDPQRYQEAVLAEFRWMEEERDLVDALMRKERMGVREAAVILKNSRRMNMRLGPFEALALLGKLVQNYQSE